MRYQINDSGLLEIIERHRRSPALQGPARLGVERPEKEGGRGDIDHAPAIDLAVGDTFAVGPPWRAQEPGGLRLAKHPNRLAGGGVDRHHCPAGGGHRVE